MKKYLLCFLMFICALSALALPSIDPFADATASGGSSYTPGANLWGQTNANLERWYGIGTTNAGAPVVINSGSLPMPAGLPASTGNSVKLGNQVGPGGRFNIGAHTSGIVFYSLAVRIDDMGTLIGANTTNHGGGAFNMAFNNSTGSDPGQQNTPTTFAGTLYMGAYTNTGVTNGYIFGIGRSTGSTNRYWETNPPHHIGDVSFVVVSYEFVTGNASNDVVRLWVNPNSSTFGAANYPTPDVAIDGTNIVSTETDAGTIASFLLANRNAGSPAVLIVDELRLGTSWADVTPTTNAVAVIPTLSIANIGNNQVQLSWRSDATGYTLQSVAQLLNSGTPWSNVAGTPTTSGTNFILTDTMNTSGNAVGGGGTGFYRLIKSN